MARSTQDATGSPRRRVRLEDVANAAGVSKSIASRVINDYPGLNVREQTRRRILSVAAELGYRPHAGARSLAGSATGALALLVPAISNPAYVNLVRGAYRRAAEQGYVLLLAEDFPDQEADGSFIGIVDAGRVDGLLVASAHPSSKLVAALGDHQVPHVFVNRSVPGHGWNVTMDTGAASIQAVDHLVGLGHRRLGHLAGPRELVSGRERESAFRSAARRAGVSDVSVAHSAFSEEGGYAAAVRLLRREPAVTALYASSFSQGVGALHAAYEIGLPVPSGLSIIAYDELPMAQYLTPSLTTIAMPMRELGAAAVDALVDQLGGAPARTTVIPTEPRVVVRGSTATAP